MGVKDTATIRMMRQNVFFADAFNYHIYGGRPVIQPSDLAEIDTRELGVPYGGPQGAGMPVQRTRDVMKAVMMADSRRAYLLLAQELQSGVHYAMPVRNMVSDSLQYAGQVERAAASHKRAKDHRSGAEYLSGFQKGDRLLPVVTLVIQFDDMPWDGPMSLHEMFGEQDGEVLRLVPDYRINLISPEAMGDGEFTKFQSTLGDVLSFIKYQKDPDKIQEMLDTRPGFHSFGREEVDVLNACVNAGLVMGESEVSLDVCEAIRIMQDRSEEKGRLEGRQEGRLEGRQEGRLEGRQEGRQEGRLEGRQEGRLEGFLEALFGLVRDGILSITEAAKRADMDALDFEEAYKTFLM